MLLGFDDLELLGIKYSRSQIARRVKDGTFPRPVRLGGNRVVWRREDVINWIRSLK
jgi:predicted DNA-binding transcriptional regulator AlpA